mgnify:CR=1 FL=1
MSRFFALVLAASIIVVIAIVGLVYFTTSGKPDNGDAIQSIAVLPFTNMSGDPEQEYFSDGISEEIIIALSRMRSLVGASLDDDRGLVSLELSHRPGAAHRLARGAGDEDRAHAQAGQPDGEVGGQHLRIVLA